MVEVPSRWLSELDEIIFEAVKLSKTVQACLRGYENDRILLLDSEDDGMVSTNRHVEYSRWKERAKTLFIELATADICSNDFLYEADGVPTIKSGPAYSDHMSLESQMLMRNIRDAYLLHLGKLREVLRSLREQHQQLPTIFISKKRGVYINNDLCYPVIGKRLELLLKLDKDPMPGKLAQERLFNSSSELFKNVRAINALFKEKLRLSEPLIYSNDLGLRLNVEHYDIRRE